MASLKAFKSQTASSRPVRRAARLNVRAAAWQKVSTKDSLSSTGGKSVVEVGGQKVLLVQEGDQVYAVSNKCSHLGLPLVGKVCP
jgi:phenylpropionate dioxygenase-like ring-hydroxylating dioxygenase large terminal subunit